MESVVVFSPATFTILQLEAVQPNDTESSLDQLMHQVPSPHTSVY